MDPKMQLALALVAVVLAVLALFVLWQVRRTKKLRRRFGPEYDRAVEEDGRGRAEAQLQDRQKRVAAFAVLPLTRATASDSASRGAGCRRSSSRTPSAP